MLDFAPGFEFMGYTIRRREKQGMGLAVNETDHDMINLSMQK